MKTNRLSPWLFSLSVVSALVITPAQAQAQEDSRFVKFKSEKKLKEFLARDSSSQRVHPALMWVEVSATTTPVLTQSEMNFLGIEATEDNSVRYAIPSPVRGFQTMTGAPGTKLWGITKIKSPTAWAITQGSEDVIVAVVDTGIDFNHPALKDNVWINTAERNGLPGVDDDANGFVDDIHGADFITSKPTPMDDEGHGTHVAGTIAGFLPAENFYGVAPRVRLMAIKTHNTKGEGSKASVVKGILYAADHGARVLNCSWGGAPEAGEFDQLLFDAIAYANKKGAVLIASAGNASKNNDTGEHYPSNYDLDGIISVASSTSTDTRSYFSNFGPRTVDLAAPGSNIWSASAGGQGYEFLSGTSMASPHVSGAAALLLSTSRGWTMTPAQIRQTLMTNVELLPEWSTRVISGGRLDVSFIGRP